MEETITNTDCQELKNIKYKTMLLNGVPLQETKSSNDLSNLDKFLENEKNNNVNEPWCKLNKTIKTKKILEYIDIYKKENNLTDEESNLLVCYTSCTQVLIEGKKDEPKVSVELTEEGRYQLPSETARADRTGHIKRPVRRSMFLNRPFLKLAGRMSKVDGKQLSTGKSRNVCTNIVWIE